jgi:hypothetical protein
MHNTFFIIILLSVSFTSGKNLKHYEHYPQFIILKCPLIELNQHIRFDISNNIGHATITPLTGFELLLTKYSDSFEYEFKIELSEAENKFKIYKAGVDEPVCQYDQVVTPDEDMIFGFYCPSFKESN